MTFIEVGRVTGIHGVRGKVRVAPLSGDPSGLLAANVVRVVGAGEGSPEREYEVVAAHRAGGCAVFSLRGVDSAEAAGALSGAAVSVRRDQLPALDDEFYWADLVGCEVVDEGGSLLGEVVAVTPGPAHDWLVVRWQNAERCPMQSPWLRS